MSINAQLQWPQLTAHWPSQFLLSAISLTILAVITAQALHYGTNPALVAIFVLGLVAAGLRTVAAIPSLVYLACEWRDHRNADLALTTPRGSLRMVWVMMTVAEVVGVFVGIIAGSVSLFFLFFCWPSWFLITLPKS